MDLRDFRPYCIECSPARSDPVGYLFLQTSVPGETPSQVLGLAGFVDDLVVNFDASWGDVFVQQELGFVRVDDQAVLRASTRK